VVQQNKRYSSHELRETVSPSKKEDCQLCGHAVNLSRRWAPVTLEVVQSYIEDQKTYDHSQGIQYRVYPNAQQEKGLGYPVWTCPLCLQFISWLCGKITAKAHKDDESKKGLTYAETNKLLTALKHTKECAWLQEADSQALQESLRNLDKAYQAFFAKRSGYPKFKKKSHDQSVH